MLKTISSLFRKEGTASGTGAGTMERRRAPRFVKQVPCDAHLRGRSIDVAPSTIRNFSVNAASLEVGFPVSIGDEIVLSFELFGTRVERVRTRVIWAVKSPAGYRCGVTTVHGTAVTGADPWEVRRVPWCVNAMWRFRLSVAGG